MIVDYKQFEAGEKLKPGLLWICSQIPTLMKSQDVTFVMANKTYWPSYNVPYFPELFSLAGYDDLVKKFGDVVSYESKLYFLLFLSGSF